MGKLSLDLPPGFRFSPTDKELIERFLKRKITGNDKDIYFVPEIEFYKLEPWDIQHICGIDSKDQEWFCFNAQSLKHQNGNRKNRTTMEGFWKATGKDREIRSRGNLIGMKKTLVYHRGRTPNGEGTKWVMHEYRTSQDEFDGTHPGQKPFVVCRLFNNEEKSKNGGSAKSKPALAPLSPASEVQVETLQTSIQSCYSEISDEMMSDVTLPVQSNNNNNNSYQAELTYTEDYFNVAEFLNMSNVPSLGDTASSLSPIAPDVLTPNISEDSTLISPLNNQDNLAVDNETLKNNGSCGGSDANGQVDLDLDIWEAFETGYINPPGQSECDSFFSPSNSTPVTPVVSSRTIAKAPLKEAESMVAPALVPLELGCEAENYPTSFRISPAKNYDGITSNTKTPIEYKNDGYNTYADRNQVEVVTSDKVEARSDMFSVSPEPLLLGNMLSPFHSQVQGESYSSFTYHPSANDCHWGVYNQYGTNEPDEYFSNASLSQNNLAVGDETLKNMASFMDNGSFGGSDANGQVDLDLDIWEAFETGYINPPGQSECDSFFSPSNSTPVTPVVSSRTIAKAPLKEAESMVAPALVPPELGCEAENYPTSFRISPAKNYDGITSNTKTPIEYKNDGYNTYADRNQVEVVTSDKVEARLNMFSVSPEPLLLGNMLSPFHSQVQGESYSSFTYHPSANDCHWGVYNQYGTNEPDEYFSNASLSQNNLAFGDETLKNMASFMDNGSFGGSDANGQVDLDLDSWEAYETDYISPPGQSECDSFFSPSNSTPVTPVVPSRTIAKAPLKEAESMEAPASVPPELGCEAENYPTSFRFSPAKNYDGITSNTKTPIEYKNDGYNTYADRNQGEVVTSDKVEARLDMFSVSPEPLLLGNMLSPFHSQVQGESYSSFTYHPSANDCHWEVCNQYGTNEPDEYFSNASLSQNNLAVGDETLKNMASFMDNGSCGGSGANAQSEQEYQGFVRLEEIIKPMVSSSV